MTTAAHRSVISAWNTRLPALGRARVWRKPPGGSGAGSTVGPPPGRVLLATVGEAAMLLAGALLTAARAGVTAAAGWVAAGPQPAASRARPASTAALDAALDHAERAAIAIAEPPAPRDVRPGQRTGARPRRRSFGGAMAWRRAQLPVGQSPSLISRPACSYFSGLRFLK